MPKAIKFFIFIGFAVALGYFAYLFFFEWGESEFMIIRDEIEEKKEKVSGFVEDKKLEYEEKAAEEMEKRSKELLEKIKRNSLDLVNKKIQDIVRFVLPLSVQTGIQTEQMRHSPFSFFAQKNIPFNLYLNNGDYYAIYWEDDVVEEGGFSGEVFLSHAWDAPGSYFVVLRIWEEEEMFETNFWVTVKE